MMGRDGTRLILCWNERWAFLAAGLETLSKQHGAESILWFHCQLPDQPHASGHRSQLATQPPVFSKMFVAQLVQSNYCIDEDDEGVKMTRDRYYLRKLLGLQIYNKTTYTDEGIP